MDSGKYIRCRNCEAIHHVTPFDRSPFYQVSAGEVHETPANDWRDFMALHAGHKLEPLTLTGNGYTAGSAADPMNAAYLEVTNGIETLLLHRTRRSIEDPVRFAVVNGRLIESRLRQVQEDEIRKEMRLHFSWVSGPPLDDAKVDLFIEIFREVVGTLDPKSVRTSGYAYSCEDENISYGQFDARVADILMAKCSEQFSPAEVQSLGRFVETHSDDGGLMAIIKRRSVTVEPRAESSTK